MKYKDLDELLQVTCSRLDFLDSYKRTPAQPLLEVMYKAVQRDFVENFDLIILTSDYAIEKKQLKYMLRKTKKLRKNTWKLSYNELVEDYKKNKINLYGFDYPTMDKRINEYKLFDEKGSPVCSSRQTEHKSRVKIFKFLRHKTQSEEEDKANPREEEPAKTGN